MCFSICSTVGLVLCDEGLFCHVGKNVYFCILKKERPYEYPFKQIPYWDTNLF